LKRDRQHGPQLALYVLFQKRSLQILILGTLLRNKQKMRAGIDGIGWLPPDHVFLDSAPDLGPLISRWELDKFKKLLKQKR
jgi:hypothetical protein